MKTCNDCKQALPVASFNKDNSKKDKLCLYCKTCVKERNRKGADANPGYRREYYLRNKIACQEKIEAWQIKNKKKFRQYQKEYYSRNKVEINRKRREQRET